MKNCLKLFAVIAVAVVMTGCNCFSKMAKNQDDVNITCTPEVLALNNGKVEADITVMDTGFTFSESPVLADGAEMRIMSFNILCELWDSKAVDVESRMQIVMATLLTYSPDHGQHPVGSIGDEPEAEGVDTSKFKGMHGTKKIEDMNILHFFGTI